MQRRTFLRQTAAAAGAPFQMSREDAEARRRQLYDLLGDLPDRNRKVSARKISDEEGPGYIIERLTLDLNGLEPVPAYFVKPKNHAGRVPVVLYNHAHGGDYQLGKDELIRGRSALQKPPYAEFLTSLGYCALCMDTWVFGERATRTELDTFKDMLWRGEVLWGQMVFDSLKGVDYLLTRSEPDPERIGTVGLSMGSTMAWWLAALDPRVKVCVDLCCLTDFDALLATNHIQGHGIYYFVPGLRKFFNTSQINALIAPRPHLALAGNLDPLTPPEGLDRIDGDLKKVYRDLGKPDNWRIFRQDVGHQETPEMRAAIGAFLKKHL